MMDGFISSLNGFEQGKGDLVLGADCIATGLAARSRLPVLQPLLFWPGTRLPSARAFGKERQTGKAFFSKEQQTKKERKNQCVSHAAIVCEKEHKSRSERWRVQSPTRDGDHPA
jgi:hypothetical protein